METKSTRKYYIDNLRSLCILLLFPFHTAMIFVDFGENWYLHSSMSRVATYFNMITYPWWMTGLFVLAGMSSVYALRHRTGKQYIVERLKKLFIPFLFALILIVPVQTYIADIYYNGYTGNYFQHYIEFFKFTDLSGYDGHFTPGHTWFILYLFLISLITLPILLWYKKKDKKIDGSRWTVPKLLPLLFVIAIAEPILDIGGKSIGEFMACFLLGYFILSEEQVQERLCKNAIPLAIVWIVLAMIRCGFYHMCIAGMVTWPMQVQEFFGELVYRSFSWIGILAMLGLGKRFLEFVTPFTRKCAAGSFPVYLLHQSVIVIIGYVVVRNITVPVAQYIIIAIASLVVSVGIYVVCKHFKATRFILGIK